MDRTKRKDRGGEAEERQRLGLRCIEDDELPNEREERDQHHGAHLHDALPALEHAQDRVVELERDQHGQDHAENRLENGLVGGVDQPRFVNAVAGLETSLSPRELLERLLDVERSLGRDRAVEERWGPRTLDLDLLLYGGESIDEPGLEVPHPRLTERAFVLEPLLELDPDLRLPDGRPLRDLYGPELE